MAEDNIVQMIKRWKPMSKRPIGRPKTRWEDYVLGDIKSINISNWKKVAQNTDCWKKVLEQARTLYRLQRFMRRRRRRSLRKAAILYEQLHVLVGRTCNAFFSLLIFPKTSLRIFPVYLSEFVVSEKMLGIVK